MQKKLIVLALAGLASSAAFAQTNVTIYGVIDVYGAYQVGNRSSTAGGDQSLANIAQGGLSGSRLGFKGEEALGNGLKAIFTYEFGTLDPSSNDSGMASQRQAFVGLSGNWGTVAAGKLQSVGYDWGVKYDTFAAAVFSPIGVATIGNGMSISGTNTGLSRVPNTVGYISPNWSGFSFKTHYSFGEQKIDDNNSLTSFDSAQGIFGIGGYYDNGPLSIGLAYHNIMDLGGTLNSGSRTTTVFIPNQITGIGNVPVTTTFTNPNAVDLEEWGIGASYDFKFLILKASYQMATTDYNTRGINDFEREAWHIGAGIPVFGNGKINVAFGQATGDAKADIFGLDYEHSLSKRTTAYIGGVYLSSSTSDAQPNKNASSLFPVPAQSGAANHVKPAADDSGYMIGAGVRHTF